MAIQVAEAKCTRNFSASGVVICLNDSLGVPLVASVNTNKHLNSFVKVSLGANVISRREFSKKGNDNIEYYEVMSIISCCSSSDVDDFNDLVLK